MLFRANTIRPGIPRALAGAAFVSDGNYQSGAVIMGPASFMVGPPAFPATYSQGVISFWANYDSSASKLGDSAKIFSAFGISSENSSYQTVCSFNAKSDPTLPFVQSSFAPIAIGCIAIFLTPTSMDLYLRDGNTFIPLVEVSVPYVKGDVSSNSATWIKIGTMPGLFLAPPTKFNGITYSGTPPFGYWAGPCSSGPFLQVNSTIISANAINLNAPGVQVIPSTDNLPTITGPIVNYTRIVSPDAYHNPSTTYPIASFPGDVYQVQFPSLGGTPTNGWHHYLWSFDVGQTVTDVNGAQCFRVQCAIDRGGGSIQGGPIYDTAAQSIGPNSQPFLTTREYGSAIVGTLLETPTGSNSNAWAIASPIDASSKWAYMYFGIPRNGFFDITAARPQGGINLDYFITSGLLAQNLGFQGSKVTPCAPQWMHTGGADILTTANVPYFQINNAASPFKFNGDFNPASIWIETGFPLVSSSDAPPQSSI